MKKLLIILIIISTFSNFTEARTAEEILSQVKANQNTGLSNDLESSNIPYEEELGYEIAQEADARDEGFGDTIVDIKMTLTNASGKTSTRLSTSKTFETPEKDLGDLSITIFSTPRDIKGTASLTHSKILEPDDQWIFLPALKRVKRISSRNKSGSYVGSEFAFEDLSSREVQKFSYKYLKTEPCPNTVKADCFVVENYPEYEYSGYTKQIGWIDTKEFRPIKIDFYDRKNSLLKTLTYEQYNQYLGKYWRPDIMEMVNHQNGKSTKLEWSNYRFKTGLKDSDFKKAKLKNAR